MFAVQINYLHKNNYLHKMEYEINQVPLDMAEIPEHLFNIQFLSDVTFVVDGKQIYAHTLELMKRSTVFIKQLRPTLGEKKLIPITDYSYDDFYQFVRFIYTDICDVNEENCIPLLNLGNEYKVTGLVNVVQKYKKINIEFNDIPYKMKEISCKFFNLLFLSDITFIVEGKEIYAHSLELMKRSSVFQQQLEPTMGEKKQIPISEYGYDIFFQFIQFIYTDECNIDQQNSLELLKLAIVYKILSLINFIQNSFTFDDFELLDFCTFVSDNTAIFGAKCRLAENFNQLLTSDEFLSAREDTVAEILKFDQIDKGTSEMDIINALVRWMKHHCTQNEIQFSDCRQKFDKLIRLIRVPTMSNVELRDIQFNYPALFTKTDLENIGGHIIFGANYEDGIWKCTPRLKLTMQLRHGVECQPTNFSVGSEMILAGFVIGKVFHGNYRFNYNGNRFFDGSYTECDIKSVNIKISHLNSEKGEIRQTPLNININNYNPKFKSSFYGNIINLGSSVRIRPNFTYTIEFKYVCSCASTHDKYWKILDSISGVVINAPPRSVQLKANRQPILAMYFLKPDGTVF